MAGKGVTDDAHKERVMELFERLKKFDGDALALELASMALSFAPFVNIQELVGRLAELSSACRRAKRSQTRSNKLTRLQELCKKKKHTKQEAEEALKLCKDLGIKV